MNIPRHLVYVRGVRRQRAQWIDSFLATGTIDLGPTDSFSPSDGVLCFQQSSGERHTRAHAEGRRLDLWRAHDDLQRYYEHSRRYPPASVEWQIEDGLLSCGPVESLVLCCQPWRLHRYATRVSQLLASCLEWQGLWWSLGTCAIGSRGLVHWLAAEGNQIAILARSAAGADGESVPLTELEFRRHCDLAASRWLGRSPDEIAATVARALADRRLLTRPVANLLADASRLGVDRAALVAGSATVAMVEHALRARTGDGELLALLQQ